MQKYLNTDERPFPTLELLKIYVEGIKLVHITFSYASMKQLINKK